MNPHDLGDVLITLVLIGVVGFAAWQAIRFLNGKSSAFDL